MTESNEARFPLSRHTARTHFSLGGGFVTQRTAGYTPSALKNAYAFDSSTDGTGVKIAIIAALDNVAVVENMRIFCNEFGLSVPEMSVHYPDGRAENTSREWLIESSLDTQWAHVFAPMSDISVVFARNGEIESLLSAAEYASSELEADIVSMCFGTEETGIDESLSAFMSDSQSVFVASSGDTGGVVSFPSSSPYCVSVGGTKLLMNLSETRRISETAYQNSGGGISDIFDIPAWQGRFFNIFGMTDGKRGTPDVAMMANTNPGAAAYVSQLGGWTTVGGTSLACACFAGICACIKQRHPDIKTSADMLSYLYGKAGTTGYEIPQYNFYDITLGRSGNYYAQTGWDFTTGLGSPVIRQLLL